MGFYEQQSFSSYPCFDNHGVTQYNTQWYLPEEQPCYIEDSEDNDGMSEQSNEFNNDQMIISHFFKEIEACSDDQIMQMLQIVSQLIGDNAFVDFLRQTHFLSCVDYLLNEKGAQNEEIRRLTFHVLINGLSNPSFRSEIIDLHIAHVVIKGYEKQMSTGHYQMISQFVRTLVKSNALKDKSQLNELKEFYVDAICHKKITVILDALEWYIRLTNGQYFDMTPSPKFLRRINQLYKYRYRNEKLQFLISRLSIFFD